VRLDHLLSKEHPEPHTPYCGCGGRATRPHRSCEGGGGSRIMWNYWMSRRRRLLGRSSTAPLVGCGTGVGWWWVGGVSACCWVLRQHPRGWVFGGQGIAMVRRSPWWGCCGCQVMFSWLVFENCIVDASILITCVVFVWCKLLRAYGGCLGIRSR